MSLLAILLTGFIIAGGAPFLVQRFGSRAFPFLALYPLTISVTFWSQLGNPGRIEVTPWLPEAGVSLALRLSGLGGLMGVLIGLLGAVILVYAGGYFEAGPKTARFAGAFLAFLTAMLGLVLSDDLILLFVFWELTSITSFLLIGHDHEDPDARQSAAQALLLTGLGGLAMLVGVLILERQTGTFRLSEMGPTAAPLALGLILCGCFTKSAQFPFHFWLPNAMAGPTPVSAFLHSATMVKAGVFLLAVLKPILGQDPLWTPVLASFGGATVLVALALMLQHRDLKKLLAYSTLSALGMLVTLLALPGETAAKAFATLLLAHALYKGGLFLMVGLVDHATGTRDTFELGGLRREMPTAAWGGLLLMLSGVGMVGTAGFWGKEYSILATSNPWMGLVVVAFGLGGGIAATRVVWTTFFGSRQPINEFHAPDWRLLLGPWVLGLGGVFFGLFLGFAGPPVLTPIVRGLSGPDAAPKWSSIPAMNLGFVLGIGLMVLGIASGLAFRVVSMPQWSLSRGWNRAITQLPPAAASVSDRVLSGKLRHAIGIVFVAITLVVVTPTLGAPLPVVDGPSLSLHELALVGMAAISAIAAIFSPGRLAAICLLGITGTSIAVLYLAYGAPDLALTQLLTELLTIVVAILVFHRLPAFKKLSSTRSRVRDAVVALSLGVAMAWITLQVQSVPHPTGPSDFFAAESVAKAYGRNVVNTILVDFRALDTMGEITVLAMAGLGVFALVRMRHGAREAG